MKLAGRVWDSLSKDERMILLRHCNTITYESIKKHEVTLSWNKLLPTTQDDLLNVDFSVALGRDMEP